MVGRQWVALVLVAAAWVGCHRSEQRQAAGKEPAPAPKEMRTPLPFPRNPVPPLKDPGIEHVLILILENGNPEQAAAARFMQLLAREGMVFNRFYGVAHPSQPNYIALISGSTEHALTNRPITLDRAHIGQTLGERWKVYAEDYPALPGKCNLIVAGGPQRAYVRRHVPFISFRDVQQGDCSQIVTLNTPDDPVAALRKDIQNDTLPGLGLIIPNLVHQGHGLTSNVTPEQRPALMRDADEWLMANIAPLLPALPDDAIFVLTFDEDETTNPINNRIYTAIWGKHVRQGTTNDVYNHYDLLATICALLDVQPPPYEEEGVRPIGGIWR